MLLDSHGFLQIQILKIYLLRVLFLIRELRFNLSVNMFGSRAVGLGVGVGSYQPGVYVPLKALFLVCSDRIRTLVAMATYTSHRLIMEKSGNCKYLLLDYFSLEIFEFYFWEKRLLSSALRFR